MGSIESKQLTLSSQWMKLAQKVLVRQEHPVAAKAFSPTSFPKPDCPVLLSFCLERRSKNSEQRKAL